MALQVNVQFANPKEFFYPEEIINGDIIVNLDRAMTCEYITLRFIGYSSCEWTDGSGNDRKFHENFEKYFDSNEPLLEASPPNSHIILQPGTAKFPFRYQLPRDLPPSFEVKRYIIFKAFVRYNMIVDIVLDAKKRSHVEKTFSFQVQASPANLTPNLRVPATETKEKFLCCLCCRSGPIRLRAEIERQAYGLGEQVVFSFDVDNRETSKSLTKIKVELVETLTFISDKGATIPLTEVKYSEVVAGEVPPRQEASWRDSRFTIPRNIVPSFSNCGCLSLEYNLVIVTKIGSAVNPRLGFPITVSSGPVLVQPRAQSRNDQPLDHTEGSQPVRLPLATVPPASSRNNPDSATLV